MSDKTQKLWGGRFSGETDPFMQTFNCSLPYGKFMYAEDIEGTRAYTSALEKVGILTSEELSEISRGLVVLEQEWASGQFTERLEDEDIHTANERRLGEIIGTHIAGKVHTGRSRNDQVATDLRLYSRNKLQDVRTKLLELVGILVSRAREEIDVIMPGYTHLQRAQPIRWSHLLSSYATQLRDDLDRLDLVLRLTNRCPLGCGALAGNPYGIDRQYLADALGFDSVLGNSLAVVGDRDFVIDALFWGTSVALHLSKMAEDFIIYSTAEFGFITLSDAYSTGSSLMPQKKNPDSLELIRGKTGTVFGNMAGYMMSVKGIPSTFNKDLSEEKRSLFDTISTVSNSLQIFSNLTATLTINKQNMRSALSTDMLATDLADYLVRKGVPFRECHHISGRVVATAEKRGLDGMEFLSLDDFKEIDTRFDADIFDVFNFEASVENRSAIGGTAKAAVLKQLDYIENSIAE